MYVCMYVCIYVCIYVCMYICMYISTYVCMYVSMLGGKVSGCQNERRVIGGAPLGVERDFGGKNESRLVLTLKFRKN